MKGRCRVAIEVNQRSGFKEANNLVFPSDFG